MLTNVDKLPPPTQTSATHPNETHAPIVYIHTGLRTPLSHQLVGGEESQSSSSFLLDEEFLLYSNKCPPTPSTYIHIHRTQFSQHQSTQNRKKANDKRPAAPPNGPRPIYVLSTPDKLSKRANDRPSKQNLQKRLIELSHQRSIEKTLGGTAHTAQHSQRRTAFPSSFLSKSVEEHQ